MFKRLRNPDSGVQATPHIRCTGMLGCSCLGCNGASSEAVDAQIQFPSQHQKSGTKHKVGETDQAASAWGPADQCKTQDVMTHTEDLIKGAGEEPSDLCVEVDGAASSTCSRSDFSIHTTVEAEGPSCVGTETTQAAVPSDQGAIPCAFQLPAGRPFNDVDWAALVASLGSSRGVGSEVRLSISGQVNPFGPREPLMFAEPNWQYKRVEIHKFLGAWGRDNDRSTPMPFPIDIELGWSTLGRKLRESCSLIKLKLSSDKKQVVMTADSDQFPLSQLVEHYNLDGSESSWSLRRDVKLGRVVGQMYQTTQDILIFRVVNYGVFSKKPDLVFEDYIWAGPNGVSLTRNMAIDKRSNKTAHQYMVGKPR